MILSLLNQNRRNWQQSMSVLHILLTMIFIDSNNIFHVIISAIRRLQLYSGQLHVVYGFEQH